MHSTLAAAIKNNIVEPALKERHHMTKAVVTEYDNLSNRANVSINNPYGQGKKQLIGVPIQLGSGGVHSAGPFKGDEVWLEYIGGNILYPRIVSLADEDYRYGTREKMRHSRKGALVPDSIGRW